MVNFFFFFKPIYSESPPVLEHERFPASGHDPPSADVTVSDAATGTGKPRRPNVLPFRLWTPQPSS